MDQKADQEREKLARLEELEIKVAREIREDAQRWVCPEHDNGIGADHTKACRDLEWGETHGCAEEAWAKVFIHRALQQWGDLRAEQVRRETEKAAFDACATMRPDKADPENFPLHEYSQDYQEGYHNACDDCAYGVRRAFAASQGGP